MGCGPSRRASSVDNLKDSRHVMRRASSLDNLNDSRHVMQIRDMKLLQKQGQFDSETIAPPAFKPRAENIMLKPKAISTNTHKDIDTNPAVAAPSSTTKKMVDDVDSSDSIAFFLNIKDENNKGIKYDKVGGERNEDVGERRDQMDGLMDRWIDGWIFK